MPPRIVPLCSVPQHREAAARLIHEEFWTAVPGASAEAMATRLALAASADQLPLCLVALEGEVPVGVVNLVENDDDNHPEWFPWLAGMVVAAPWRGKGIGSALVLALLEQAWALGHQRVYFGTDGPAFYARLGAIKHQQPRPGFWFMRFDAGAGA